MPNLIEHFTLMTAELLVFELTNIFFVGDRCKR